MRDYTEVIMKSTAHSLQPTVRSLFRPAVCSPQPTAYGLRPGFTLIEVLVAMTVLAVMVLLVANIFQQSSAAWNIGTQKADMNTAARAALDYMARELACAVAGPIEKAVGSGPSLASIKFELNNGGELFFVTLAGDVENGRALQGASFYLTNNQLMYARQTASFNPYNDSPNKSGAGMLVSNVLDLQISAFTNEYGLVNGLFTADFDSSVPANSDQLPLCVDIALEMLSGDDMQRYIAAGSDPVFRARNAKLYSTRVYFPNRVGYGGR